MKGLLPRILGLTLLAASVSAPSRTAGPPQGTSLTVVHFKAPEFPSAELEFARPGGQVVSPAIAGPGAGRTGGLGNPSSMPETAIPSAPPVAWINSPSLTVAGLRGKVVLIDFWEYTCINCIRTFAQNKKWYERYRKYGFEIIGVHDPEFDIAYPESNVQAAVKRFGLPYPVVVDNQFKVWNSYRNSTWPNRFVIDAKGFVRFNRPGEGADSDFERAIQSLLVEAHPGLKFPETYTIPPEEDASAPNCGIPTPEMYVGDWYNRGVLANPESYHPGKTVQYKIAGEVKDGQLMLSGAWETDKNGMIYRGKPKRGQPGEDGLEIRYHARELYAVMNVSRGRPSKLFVLQDGKDLTPANKGVDVQFDRDGHSYIEVRAPRMYYLVQNTSFGQHQVRLVPTSHGMTINSFTFGNDCQTQFPHL